MQPLADGIYLNNDECKKNKPDITKKERMFTNDRIKLSPISFKKLTFWVIVIFLTVLTTSLGIFSSFDIFFYNAFSRTTPTSSGTANKVLLVEVPYNQREADDKVWLSLLNTLDSLGPQQIVFTFMPRNVTQAFYQKAAQSHVIFGRNIREESGHIELLEEMPQAVGKEKLAFGVLATPRDELGTYRTQVRSLMVEGRKCPTLENVAAKSFSETSLFGNEYYVNFMGRKGPLSTVELERFLTDGVIPELVKGKSVLVGFKDSLQGIGLLTPLDSKKRLAPFEFHGYALDTLLSKKPILKLPAWANILLVVVVVVLGIFVQGFLDIKVFSWITAVAVTSFLVFCWLVLAFAHIWIQPADCLAAFMVTFAVTFYHRASLAEQGVNTLLYSLSLKLKQRSMPESFQTSTEYWSQVISLVNQTLHLTRSIFLEKIPNDHRVREVKSLNCSISDIKEMRRDYHREPYTSAIQKGGVVQLSDRLFLAEDNEIGSEIQFLVPLAFGGQTLGFWAFGIHDEHLQELHDFEQTIQDFSVQISELLFRRQEWQQQNMEKTSMMANSLDTTQGELAKAVALTERRYGLLDAVFQGMATSAILYDLFGRVLHVNKSMVELLSVADIAPYQMTALDLITALSGSIPEQVRTRLRLVLLERHEVTFMVQHKLLHHKHLLLKVRPMIENINHRYSDGPSPFSSVGFLLEVIETAVRPSDMVPYTLGLQQA